MAYGCAYDFLLYPQSKARDSYHLLLLQQQIEYGVQGLGQTTTYGCAYDFLLYLQTKARHGLAYDVGRNTQVHCISHIEHANGTAC